MNAPSRQIAMPVLGAQASGFYQAELNRLYARLHGHKACPLLLVETDFESINANLPDNYAALAPLLASLFGQLAATGAARYLLPNITLHTAVDRLDLPAAERAKIVHPLEVGIRTLGDRDIDRMTLAGTRHTMRSDQLAGYFEEQGITVESPASATIDAVDELRLAVFNYGYSRALEVEMERLLSPLENVVLACTELSILNRHESFIDLARISMADAIDSL